MSFLKSFRPFFLLFCSFFLFALFAACSDGRIVPSTPSIGGEDTTSVGVDEDIVITFGTPVAISTVTTSSFFIVLDPQTSLTAALVVQGSTLLKASDDMSLCDPANAIEAIISCSSSTSCSLTPVHDFDPGTDYVICLTSDIQYEEPDIYGVFQATTLSFRTVTSQTETTETFSVGGTVTGLDGTVVLQNNEGDDLSITSDDSFTFTTSVPDAENYAVTVLTQPASQTCTISNSSGTIAGANVTNVSVTCADNPPDTFTVGGTLNGLSGNLVLQNSGGNNLSLSSDQSFTFSTALVDGASYVVSVLTQPAGQTCIVSSSSGTITGANVTNVSVTCTDNTFTIGGTVSGLFAGYEMELSNNGGDALTVEGTADGNVNFTFSTSLEDESDYAVTITAAPQDCDVTQGSGTISGANKTNITVTCSQRTMFVSTSTYNGNLKGGAASGAAGADLKCAADPQCPDGFECQAMLGAILDSERTACSTANCSGGDNSEHVDWVLLPSTAYVRPDGTTLVGITNANAIFDFDLDNGVVDTQQLAWTGLNRDWTTHFFKCFSWTSEDPGNDGYQGEAGDASAVDNTFNDFFNFSGDPVCSTLHPLICVAHDTL